MARSVKEWIGKDDDARPPRSVKMRVFLAYDGKCHLTGQKIAAGVEWDLDHVKPLHLAPKGENWNRESNLAPALKAPHRVKSAREVSDKAKADRIWAKNHGQWPDPVRKMPSRPFPTNRRSPV